MLSEIYYLIRSRNDGKYLTARVEVEGNDTNYLLLFKENFEALSYLNTHAGDLADRFTVESISNIQLKGVLQRWGFQGMGIVKDPLLPTIEFLSIN